MSCAVYGCKNNSFKNRDLKFHGFPRDENMCKQWIVACRRQDKINTKSARVCSSHFQPSDYFQLLRHRLMGYCPNNYRNLKSDAVPSINIPTKKDSQTESKRSVRVEKRARRKIALELLAKSSDDLVPNEQEKTNLDSSVIDENEQVPSLNTSHLSVNIIINEPEQPTTQTAESTADLQREIKELKSTINSLNSRMQHLKTEQESFMRKRLKTVFSDCQIDCLFRPTSKRIHWSDEDITSALTLRSFSPNAYWYLRKKRNYPLPAVSTLRKWVTRKLELQPSQLTLEVMRPKLPSVLPFEEDLPV